jgi:CRISPR-associated endonuclease/helicase Cas3
MIFSTMARSCWAKTPDGEKSWTSLQEHSERTVEYARRIWSDWLPYGTKEKLECGFGINVAAQLFYFLAVIHDIGKATPIFQLKPGIDSELRERVLNSGLPGIDLPNNGWSKLHHSLASQFIMEDYGGLWSASRDFGDCRRTSRGTADFAAIKSRIVWIQTWI